MSISSVFLKTLMNHFDVKRDKGLTSPDDVTRCDNLQYGADPKWNALDVYYPKGTDKPLPTIVSIHGGGYVYGTKEVYQFYGMSFAQRGFTFVNFNYHLAPGAKFPTQLHEINAVMTWVVEHAEQYHIDTNNIFIVGDSAGAQMCSQYALVWADAAYAKLMEMQVPNFRLGAVGLNCGMYELKSEGNMKSLVKNYLGATPEMHTDRMDVLSRISASYPPAYVMSFAHDFLRANAQPMAELLRSRGVDAEWKVYGDDSDKMAQHVAHCNMRYPIAHECNNDEAAFFRKYIK